MIKGKSLPNETSTKLYWKGTGMLRLEQLATQNSLWDQTFILNSLSGPCFVRTATGTSDPRYNLHGKWSYQDLWAQLYSKALITGCRFQIVLRKPLFPLTIMRPNVRTENDRGDLFAQLPSNVTKGYWYLRYRYTRAQDPSSTLTPTRVGHSMISADNDGRWENLRQFQTDPTVLWFADSMPSSTRMTFSIPNDHTNLNPAVHMFPSVVGTTTNNLHQGGMIHYQVNCPNKPVKLIGAFSLRKHSDDKNILRNSQWTTISDIAQNVVPSSLEDQDTMFLVRIGYIGFDQNGFVSTSTPPDLVNERNIEITCAYKVRLREPKIQPFPDGSMIPLNPPAGASSANVILPEEEEADMLEEDDNLYEDDDVTDDDGEVTLEE